MIPATALEVGYLRGHGTLGPLLRTVQDGNGRLSDIRIEDEEFLDGRRVRRVIIPHAGPGTRDPGVNRRLPAQP
jgi:hypothetical protein